MAKKFKHQAVADVILAKLRELPDETETCTSEIVEKLYGKWDVFEFEDYFDIDYCVRTQAKDVGLLLDDTPWAGMKSGLPFHCPYIVRQNPGGRMRPMMISPEGYYNSELIFKTHDQILGKIAGLKREIARLKRIMEHPDYQCMMLPSEDTQLWCTRLYLERAKEALAEVGAPYEPTAAEKRVMDFDANIDNIAQITLHIGGFFSDRCKYMVRLDDQLHFCVESTVIPPPTNVDIPADCPMTKEEFLASFAELHVGEWRRNYDTKRFGIITADGTQWELIIEYNNGHKTFISGGSNSYPYNFRKLTELLGVGDNDDEPEEHE